MKEFVTQYYTGLKKLWDEISCIILITYCACGIAHNFTEVSHMTKLIQFLMGLNDSNDNIQNQILLMDPIPTVNKAYSMMLRVEKQREVHTSYSNVVDQSAHQLSAGSDH